MNTMNTHWEDLNSPSLAQYAEPDEDPQIRQLNNEVDETKKVLLDTCDKLIDREGKLDNMAEKTELLRDNSTSFRRNTSSLKRQMWIKQYQCPIIISIFLILIIIIIAVSNTKKK